MTVSPDYECDLHCHTTRSDGNDTPGELLDLAVRAGLKAVAITDHDIDPLITVDKGSHSVDIKAYARTRGLRLVLGYEFSCDTDVDDVHILGYELDWDDPLIKKEVERARQSKADAYKELCRVLTGRNMPVDYEKEILAYKDCRGNIRSRDPYDVQRKHIFELMAGKGYAPSWDKAKLMVRDDPDLNVRREKISPLEAIDLIHECGGLAVLAHPYLIDGTVSSRITGEISRDGYIQKLLDRGLDGIESCYTYDKTTYKGKKTNEEIKKEIEDRYKDRVKFFTGGSDYHGDGKKGVKDPRYLGEAGISFEEFRHIFYVGL
jgi:3',5'-nucleoside bisphosphate phosphatase